MFAPLIKDTKAYLMEITGNNTALVEKILSIYAIGKNGIESQPQQAAAIYRDYEYQCGMSVVANDTKVGHIPSYR